MASEEVHEDKINNLQLNFVEANVEGESQDDSDMTFDEFKEEFD